MIHKTCPICNSKLVSTVSERRSREDTHVVYECQGESSHKYWVSEYEPDCLRWNPGATHTDILYFRKFKYTDREAVRDEAIRKLVERVNSKEHLDETRDCDDDTEHFGRQDIQRNYDKTPEYLEVFDKVVNDNLLGIIQSQNETIAGLIEEYKKLNEYTDELQEKYDNATITGNTTPSGIILRP